MELDFSNPQVCVFVGKPKQGKSWALRHQILKQTADNKIFKYGIVFTRTKFNGQYDYLPDEYVYEDYNPDILQQYLDGLKQLDQKDIEPSFVIFDDIQGLLSSADASLTQLVSNHRHFQISVFFCFQYIYGRASTPVLRECTTMAFLFNSKGKRTLEALFESFGQLFDNFKEFKEYFLACTKEKHTAMLYIQDIDDIKENYLQYKAPSPKDMKHVKNIKLAY